MNIKGKQGKRQADWIQSVRKGIAGMSVCAGPVRRIAHKNEEERIPYARVLIECFVASGSEFTR